MGSLRMISNMDANNMSEKTDKKGGRFMKDTGESSSLRRICGNCREIIGNDRFCRYCGSENISVMYEPEEDVVRCIYGPPPVMRKHTCSECGYSWSRCLMIDNENYCPKCGGRTVIVAEGKEE